MTLHALRTRAGASIALGLGVTVVLAIATTISQRFIETTGARARVPLLRPAAVFAPTLVRTVGQPSGVDAIAARIDGRHDPAAPPGGGHAPQPIPEELWLGLVPGAASGADEARESQAAPTPEATPSEKDAPAGPAKPRLPQLEVIEQDLWGK